MFVVGFLSVAAMVIVLAHEENVRSPKLSQVEVVRTMREIMLKNDTTGRDSHIADFQSLEGPEGVRKGNRLEPIYFYGINCFNAHLVKDGNGNEVTPPKPEPFCVTERGSTETINTEDILKYRLTMSGSASIWFASLLAGLAWAAALSVPILNLYYRGLVYVVCGPRKRTVNSSAA